MNRTEVKLPWQDWEISGYLGGGSFGTVYEIQRRLIGSGKIEKAAVKVVSIPKDPSEVRELLNNGYDMKGINQRYFEDLQYIAREYDTMAELKGNANIVYCDDVRYEQNADGVGWTLCIRMELLKPLDQLPVRQLHEAQVVKLGMDLCNALMACKRNNILHRDIKPANIMIAKDGTFKLGDFGVAKTVESTAGGTKTGTYNYMAPEVYNNRSYGLQADIYSAGMVMYWMLNRRCGPFLPLPPKVPSARLLDEAKQRRFSGEPLPPPVHGSEELKRIVLKACAYDPAQRYNAPEELYADLAAILDTASEEPFYTDDIPPSPEHDPNTWHDDPTLDNPPPEPSPIPDEPDPPAREADMPKSKKKSIALLLAVFPYTGLFGVHDFYLGHKKSGLFKLCTVNLCGVGWLIDVFKILLGMYKTPDGNYLK